jgi:hypothetical protein
VPTRGYSSYGTAVRGASRGGNATLFHGSGIPGTAMRGLQTASNNQFLTAGGAARPMTSKQSAGYSSSRRGSVAGAPFDPLNQGYINTQPLILLYSIRMKLMDELYKKKR